MPTLSYHYHTEKPYQAKMFCPAGALIAENILSSTNIQPRWGSHSHNSTQKRTSDLYSFIIHHFAPCTILAIPFHFSLFTFLLYTFTACQPQKQFKLLSPDDTNIQFVNELTIADSMNILDNELVYNGGGVAVGDWNGDGFQDIFFTANMADNALYLNRIDKNGAKMRFEDVTKKAGLNKPRKCWSAGATVLDINNDGKLDLYVSNMMYGDAEMRRNLLYVNQGNDAQGIPTFKDMGKEYGLDNDSHSAQTVFFDYDNDGDLDAYILVNVMDMQFANQYMSKAMQANSPTSDRLLRNDSPAPPAPDGGALTSNFSSPIGTVRRAGGGSFTDVSKTAGIEAQGYGHGVAVMDINKDGWLDLYVTNDYLSNDNLFINNHDGTFRDSVHVALKHQSWSAMGNDVTDVNNDGLLDLLSTDMLPDYNERKKALLRANSYTHYLFTEQYQYEYQHIRNNLQLNRGNDPTTGMPRFSEIGMMAGVSETDWSWCPLWIDADNDGHRDLLITNGFPKDITDQDFLAYRNDAQSVQTSKAELYKMIPEVKIPNYFFRNKGDLTFSDQTKDWGFDTPTFSNGAAYADFDNDGDLDIVMNNINDYAHLYENKLNQQKDKPNYLRIKLVGTAQNPMGIGAKVSIYAAGQLYYAEQSVVRGYLSTSEAILHFGLGKVARVDSVQVIWPDGKLQELTKIAVNQVFELKYSPQLPTNPVPTTPKTTLFQEIAGPVYRHLEGDYIDFNSQKTLPHKYSQYGPSVAVGDVNNDGLEDFFLGGSSRVDGTFFLQQKNGTFKQQIQNLKTGQKKEEDLGSLFFDADGDGDLDLYCVRGGYQHPKDSPLYQDALFLNDGKGNFKRDSLAIPRETACGQTVRAADFDHDGDLDLFVGGRVSPQNYPQAERSFILRNNSIPLAPNGGIISTPPSGAGGLFTDVTRQIAPQLEYIGMISDALWTDYDNDGWPDLLLAGEWMPLTFVKNSKGRFMVNSQWSMGVKVKGEGLKEKGEGITYFLDTKITTNRKDDLAQTTNHKSQTTNHKSPITNAPQGWWNSLCAADFDNDGDIDYMAGNYGLNTAYKASETEPLWVYAKDFDANGSYDAIIAQTDNNAKGQRNLFPFHTRDDLIKQSLLFRKRFLKYADFGLATQEKVLTKPDLKDALVLKTNWLQSSYLENLGNGQFRLSALPVEAQLAPVFGMMPYDTDNDGLLDVLMVGNDYGMELFQGRADAFYGLVLKNNKKGIFSALSMPQTGFVVPDDARALTMLPVGNRNRIVATQNKGTLKWFGRDEQPQKFIALQPQETAGVWTLANGQKRRVEFYYGATFLSQQSRTIAVPTGAKSLDILAASRTSRRLSF